ncbi:hypothetical protein Scep_028658 [Stephania cephalantha]|uniref:BHLH domain-containing protein n=1 Tax=Stephania cephalantha TaxID=152367 RepID=A0AAP0EAB9_9MAGN
MAEGFRSGLCSGNWWSNTTATTTASDMGGGGGVVNVSYGSSSTTWSSDQMAEINAIKALSSTSSQESDSIGGGGGGGASVLMDSSLQMMDFGLSCPTNDHWSQALLHERSSIDHVFNLEQQQQQHQDHLSPSSSTTTNNSSSILRGLFEPSDQHHLHHHLQPHQHQLAQPNYMTSSSSVLPHQFLKTSPPKQQLHFSNNTAFWNPSAAMTNNINNSPPPGSFFSSSPSTLQAQVFDKKANCSNLTLKTNKEEKKSNSSNTSTESTFKRPRIETPTPLPTFKVRKEKLGDRITALQQLVSPFGKTDTASVLFEAIEYIKFLHEQVGALSTPYMKSGSSHHIQYQQNSDKLKDYGEGSKQDLRSRGLCLVPISSTFPVATETSADFWTPTYGGTYR